MQLGIIGPVSALRKLKIGTMHLILTSQVLSNKEYVNFYKERLREGDYVILDNDAHEQKAASSLTLLDEAIKIIRPSEVVLPDVIRNRAETVERTIEGIKHFRVDNRDRYADIKLMAVAQGNTVEEWEQCKNQLWALDSIVDYPFDVIGIPRVYADDFNTWVTAVRRVCDKMPPIEIHLLGSPFNIDSAAEIERHFPTRVRSTDTAKPIHYALDHTYFEQTMRINAHDKRPIGWLDSTQRNIKSRPQDFFDVEMSAKQIHIAQTNINRMEWAISADLTQ